MISKEKRKKILLIGDDVRMTSGVSTILREIVIGTTSNFNWVQIAGAINHQEQGKRLDLSIDTNKQTGLTDSSVILYPTSGYGDPDLIRFLIKEEKPDAIMFMTDPRYYIWLFQIEHEIRQKIPMIYLNIWDDLPYPMYNKSYYESCDALFAISKQTENINKCVLGEDISQEKIIKYIPHGINEYNFFPISQDQTDWLALEEFKKQLFNGKKYNFVLLYNARNIRRKSVPDLMLAWKIFIDTLSEEEANKCAFVLHTQPIDENGTNLLEVKEMIFGNNPKYNIIFSVSILPIQGMNLLYNSIDITALISSNEGWGLSLTESMMCGRPIIGNVTGGMQDQMRFEDEHNEWVKFTNEFGSNHRGKYKKCGKWAFPVFPSNISLVGSVPTPYIFDDRVSPEDIATEIHKVYKIKTNTPEEYSEICSAARKWVTSDESKMSAKNMCNNIIEGIQETLDNFEPRHKFEFIEVEKNIIPRNYVKYPIAQ